MGLVLSEEIKRLDIVALEGSSMEHQEDIFAALGTIEKHNQEYPVSRLLEMDDRAMDGAFATMSGTDSVS